MDNKVTKLADLERYELEFKIAQLCGCLEDITRKEGEPKSQKLAAFMLKEIGVDWVGYLDSIGITESIPQNRNIN